jgi:hypothetical protein
MTALKYQALIDPTTEPWYLARFRVVQHEHLNYFNHYK